MKRCSSWIFLPFFSLWSSWAVNILFSLKNKGENSSVKLSILHLDEGWWLPPPPSHHPSPYISDIYFSSQVFRTFKEGAESLLACRNGWVMTVRPKKAFFGVSLYSLGLPIWIIPYQNPQNIHLPCSLRCLPTVHLEDPVEMGTCACYTWRPVLVTDWLLGELFNRGPASSHKSNQDSKHEILKLTCRYSP